MFASDSRITESGKQMIAGSGIESTQQSVLTINLTLPIKDLKIAIRKRFCV